MELKSQLACATGLHSCWIYLFIRIAQFLTFTTQTICPNYLHANMTVYLYQIKQSGCTYDGAMYRG